MPYDPINLGAAANDRSGDDWRTGGEKINTMFEELFLNQSAQIIILNSESSFPTQDANTITLESGFVYVAATPFTTSKNFICEGGSIVSLGSDVPLITYTGTSPMFTVTNNRLIMNLLHFSCPNANVFSLTGDGLFNPDHRVNMENCEIASCTGFGTANNFGAFVTGGCGVNNFSGSTFMSFSGTGYIVTSFSKLRVAGFTAAAVGIDLGTSTHLEIEVQDYIPFGDATAIPISIAAASANLLPGEQGTIVGCNLKGFNTPISGRASSDIQWEVFDNAGVSDSQNAGNLYLDIRPTATDETITVSTAGDWYEIGTATGLNIWADGVDDRFQINSAGYLEYIGLDDIDVLVVGTTTVEKVGGGSDALEARIALNWTGATTDGGIYESGNVQDSTTPGPIPLSALVRLSTNDNLRPIYANNTGTANILVSRSSLEAKG